MYCYNNLGNISSLQGRFLKTELCIICFMRHALCIAIYVMTQLGLQHNQKETGLLTKKYRQGVTIRQSEKSQDALCYNTLKLTFVQ